MTIMTKETVTHRHVLNKTITRLKSPLETSLDKILQALIDIILQLSPEKRAMLIELISRSMPAGYLRVSYIPPQPTPPVTKTVDTEDEWLSVEMDAFLADYKKRKATEIAIKQGLLNEQQPYVTD